MTGAVELIVDSGQARVTGAWQVSSYHPRSYGATYHSTNRSAFSAAPRTVTWPFSVPRPGDYSVSVWLPDGADDRTTAARYRVHHAGSVSEFTVDQTAAGGRWIQLGAGPLPFAGSAGEGVELRVADVPAAPEGAALFVVADAVRVATPPPPLTRAPMGLSASAGRNYVELAWDRLGGADSYLVTRTDATGTARDLIPGTGTALLDLDVDAGASYSYSVRGVNARGPGPASPPLAAGPAAGPPLQGVQGLRIEDVHGTPLLTWQPSRDATTYLIERATRSGGTFQVIATVTGTRFIDPVPPLQAFYTVRSANAYGKAELCSWQVNWRR